jgi:hypothetical protein
MKRTSVLVAAASLALVFPTSLVRAEEKASPAAPASAATAPAKAAAVTDLSSAKTAPDAWKVIETQMELGPATEPKSREEALAFASTQMASLEKLAAELQKSYPDSAERWDAELLVTQLNAARRELGLPGEDAAKSDARLGDILKAGNASSRVKGTASAIQLMSGAEAAQSDGGEKLKTWRAAANTHRTTYPDFEGNPLISFAEAELVKTSDPAESKRLLGELSNSKDPRVAQQAKSLLEAAEAPVVTPTPGITPATK